MTAAYPALTQQQVDDFHRDGFVAVEAVTSPAEVQQLRTIYDRIFAERAGRATGDQFDLAGDDSENTVARLPQILNPSRYAPELADARFRRNGLAMVRQLLGETADYQGEHAILKPARYGAPTPWHQDEAYWDGGLDYTALSMWVPLQDATIENGCMQFIPGSHQFEVQPHHSIGNDVRVHGLEIDEVDASTAVACPIPAGGATFHLSRTLHYAGPNNTAEPRRAYIIMFGTPPRRRAQSRDFFWNTIKRTPREDRARQWEASQGTAEPKPG